MAGIELAFLTSIVMMIGPLLDRVYSRDDGMRLDLRSRV